MSAQPRAGAGHSTARGLPYTAARERATTTGPLGQLYLGPRMVMAWTMHSFCVGEIPGRMGAQGGPSTTGRVAAASHVLSVSCKNMPLVSLCSNSMRGSCIVPDKYRTGYFACILHVFRMWYLFLPCSTILLSCACRTC